MKTFTSKANAFGQGRKAYKFAVSKMIEANPELADAEISGFLLVLTINPFSAAQFNFSSDTDMRLQAACLVRLKTKTPVNQTTL